MRQIFPFILMFILLLASACDNETGNDPSGLTLLTRSEVATVAGTQRLLVFGTATGNGKTAGSDDACLYNYAFTSGSAIALATGTYRFVVLGNPNCFDLPAAGTTEGIAFDRLLLLKSGATLETLLVSKPEEITLPDTRIYTTYLHPATCLVKLILQDAPQDLSLQLTNMSSGLSFSGTYAENVSLCTYPLQEGENICLPTGSNALLRYEKADETGTLDLGIRLEPGYTYQIPLQWHAGTIGLTSEVTMWQDGNHTDGSAD